MYRTSKILEGKIFILIRYFTKDPRVNRPKALIGRRAKEIKYDLLCVRERQTCLHRIKWLPLLTSVIAAIYFISFAPLYPYRALGQDEDASRPLVKCRLTTSKKKGGGGTREDDASVVAPNPSARSAVRRALGAKRNEKKKTGRSSPFKAAVDIVGHEEQHAELFQGNELHVPLIALAHAQPLEQGLRVHLGHLRTQQRSTRGYKLKTPARSVYQKYASMSSILLRDINLTC